MNRHQFLRSALAAVAAATLLVACGGGGGDSASPGTPPVGAASAFTEGTISGFGSVIVGGVRFDDSSAVIEDDDGSRHGSDDLKLGMTVTIDSSAISNGAATATRISFGSEIVGPVESIDVAGGELVVIGQTIQVNGATVFDDSLAGGLSAIPLGSAVEVYARYDAASGTYVATRIEDKNSPNEYRVRGAVANLDKAAQTFTLGDAVIAYGSARDVPADLANGQWVRVRVQTVQVNGAWVANRLKSGRNSPDDHDEAEVKGTITAYTSAQQFSVNGLPVDASRASFPEGTSGIALGAFVEVEGRMSNGVLVARKVKPEDEGDDDSSSDDRFESELHGKISGLDTAAQTFTLRGVKVSYAGAAFERGTAANLANGVEVEVKGTLAADGNTIAATEVKFED